MTIFSLANQIVLEEQERAGKFDQRVKSSSCFMYRDEIKELMLLLFSLCEYNLKAIF